MVETIVDAGHAGARDLSAVSVAEYTDPGLPVFQP